MALEGVAGDDGVDEDGAACLRSVWLTGQFAIVLFAAVGAHDQRDSGGVVAEGDGGSEFAFAAEGEAFGEEVVVGREPLVDSVGKGVGVDLVDDVVEGIVAGEFVQAVGEQA